MKAKLTELEQGKYHEWRHRLLTYARSQRLAKYLEQDLVKPDDDTREEFDFNDAHALSLIHSTIDSENYQIVANCNSARSAFLALCKHHDDGGGLTTATIFSELVTMRLSSEDDLSKHLFEFRRLHNKLIGNLASRPDLKISDPFIAIILLKSLPSSFSALVQTTLASFKSITLERIYSLLSMEVNRHVTTNSNETALVVSAPSTSKTFIEDKRKKYPKKKAFNRDLHCSLGHIGHTDENCRDKLLADLTKEVKDLWMRGTKSETAKVATINEDDKKWNWDESYYVGSTIKADEVIVDSGSTNHMFNNKSYFSSISPMSPSCIGVASKGTTIWAKEKGVVKIQGLTLHNVLYSPMLASNLLSVGQLCDEGYNVNFSSKNGSITSSDKKILIPLNRDDSGDRLWHPQVQHTEDQAYAAYTSSDLVKLWHARLGHAHMNATVKFVNRYFDKSIRNVDFGQCQSCIIGKITQSPATSPLTRSNKLLDVIHTDLLGPISPCTSSGMKYIMTFVDDSTRRNWIYLLRSKDEAYQIFVEFKARVEKETGLTINRL